MGLFLGADKQNVAAICDHVADVDVCLFDTAQALAEIQEVDSVALTQDVALHLGIPTTGLVPEMHTCLEEFFHGDNGHGGSFPRFHVDSLALEDRSGSRDLGIASLS